MENNEIMNNEEIIETAMEIANTTSNRGLNKAASIGLGVLIGAVATKYVLIPVGAKVKTWHEERKAKKYVAVDNDDYADEDVIDLDDSKE